MRRIIVALLLASISPALAHDPTGFWAKEIADGRAPPAEWWNGLHAPNATHSCCSAADGARVEDVDWDTNCKEPECHYRVWLLGAWRDVPDKVVVLEPNKYGAPVVWPVYAWDSNGIKVFDYVRCFLPGAGT